MQLLEIPSAYRPGVTPPPRPLCMTKGEATTNEFVTINRLVPACGRRPDEAVMTSEKVDVTCPDCLAVLGGGPSTYQPARRVEVTTEPGVALHRPLPATPSGYRQLVDALNVEQLEAKRNDLEGELAAVLVLLTAARAREKKINQGAGGA